jgi:3-hydroxybutyryl-CoA dehydratase
MEKIIIGKEVEFSKIFSSADVLEFSRISEDDNPVHIDEAYAAESIFGKRVVHGILLMSMFSKIFGTIYPGNGAIYLSQTSKFIKPAFIDDVIKAKIKLISFNDDNKQGVFLTECFKESDKLILTGDARILFPKTFQL